MKGGAKEQMIDILMKYTKPLDTYIGLALVLGIVYVRQIPPIVRIQANNILGRLLLFLLTLAIADMYSCTYGIMMALFTILLLAVSPRIEGFQVTVKRWFSEELLKENPLAIIEEKVNTSAIQDNSNAASTGYSHSSK